MLDTLVESAARLCEAERASIWRPRGSTFHLAASHGHTAEWKNPMHDQELESARAISDGGSCSKEGPSMSMMFRPIPNMRFPAL